MTQRPVTELTDEELTKENAEHEERVKAARSTKEAALKAYHAVANRLPERQAFDAAESTLDKLTSWAEGTPGKRNADVKAEIHRRSDDARLEHVESLMRDLGYASATRKDGTVIDLRPKHREDD